MRQTKLVWDSTTDELKVCTREYPSGVELPENKFVVHKYKAKSGHASRAGIMRVVSWMYLFKNYDIKDWVSFCEVFGMPLRLGKYDASASESDKKQLMEAIISLGTDAAGIVPSSTMIEFIESQKTTSVEIYEKLARYCDEQISKAILGQTLTSDSGGGSYAQSKTHNEVRHDLTVADAKSLAVTIRRDIIRPLVEFNYGSEANIPFFGFDCHEVEDQKEVVEIYKTLACDMGLALIDLLYNNVETLDSGIQDLQGSMKNGISVTEEMAEAINNTPEQKFQVLKQQIHNNVEELGNGLLPAVNNTMDKVSGLIQKGSKWISNNQETVQSIMNIALKLGVFLVIAGSVMGVIGSLGKLFLSAKNAIGLVKTATLGMNTAFLASPITWVIAGIVALVAAFVVLWNKSEAFRGFWIGLFEQVKSSFMQAWQTLKPALQNLGQKFMELYQAVQPILEVLGAVLGAVLTVALGHFVGCIQGIISALTPLTNALSSLVSFVTNVVNMIVSLFKGDFSGALDFASAAVGDLKDFFFNCFDAILSFLGGFASGFLDVVGGALSAIGIDARGYVSIYRSEYNNALQVTKGHCFKTEPDAGGNELKFYCCENTVIDAGEPVGRVLVEAEATGTYYNIAPGRITICRI